jgi:hypothetical protein
MTSTHDPKKRFLWPVVAVIKFFLSYGQSKLECLSLGSFFAMIESSVKAVVAWFNQTPSFKCDQMYDNHCYEFDHTLLHC